MFPSSSHLSWVELCPGKRQRADFLPAEWCLSLTALAPSWGHPSESQTSGPCFSHPGAAPGLSKPEPWSLLTALRVSTGPERVCVPDSLLALVFHTSLLSVLGWCPSPVLPRLSPSLQSPDPFPFDPVGSGFSSSPKQLVTYDLIGLSLGGPGVYSPIFP